MLTLIVQCRYQYYGMFLAKKEVLLEGFITHSEEIFLRELFPAFQRGLENNALSVNDLSMLVFDGHSLGALAALRGLCLALSINPVVKLTTDNDTVLTGQNGIVLSMTWRG